MAYTEYLTLSDYYASIQRNQIEGQLLDALNINNTQRKSAESWAIGKVYGLLSSQYDLDSEFTDTLPYNNNKTYYAGSRVWINYDEYSVTSTYKTGDCVIKDNNGYVSLQDQAAGVFDESKWNGIGEKYSIWNIPYPYPIFNLTVESPKGVVTKGYYKVGDVVWWENHTYKCKSETSIISHDSAIQYDRYSDIGYPNVFPNDSVYGSSQWEDLGEYTIERGKYPYFNQEGGEPSVWEFGDNRDPVTVKAVIDLSIWMLHNRISSMNIPKFREENKNFTFAWLRAVSGGTENINIRNLQPPQNEDIVWFSKPKNINGWV